MHRIDAAAERLEVFFDELEQGGRRFTSPRSSGFTQPQLAVEQQGDETCRVEVVCMPPMSAVELRFLATRVSTLLAELPDVTPRGVRAVDRGASEADTDPGEPPTRPDDVATREHLAKARREVAVTRPEGVKRRPPQLAVDGADEVTDPQGDSPREDAPTRPQGVISIRRRPDEES